MRILRLHIQRHLLLRDLSITFDRVNKLDLENYALDFLVGVNGSGKSTILRALAKIFSALEADRLTDFNYKIEYELGYKEGPLRVKVQQSRENGKLIRRMIAHLLAEDGSCEKVYDADSIDRFYLPENIIIYTTGSEEEWELLLEKNLGNTRSSEAPKDIISDSIQREIMELPGHLAISKPGDLETAAEQPILLIRSSRLKLMTLSGLIAHLSHQKNNRQPLSEALESSGISKVNGFSLKFRLHSALSDYSIFNRLKPFASRHIQQGADHLLVFDLTQNQQPIADAIIRTFGDSLSLFIELDRLLNISPSGEPILQQINIHLERDITFIDDPITKNMLFDWLSDGEQSFLGRMALLVMLDTEDSLIMLDEPEIHFNDYWKREIIRLLDNVMEGRTNHLLITTHSSILLSDVTEAHISSIVKRPNGIAEVVEISTPTFGANPSSIMVHMFDTGTSVGSFSGEYISEALERGDIDELKELLDQVGVGYWSFRISNRLDREEEDAS